MSSGKHNFSYGILDVEPMCEMAKALSSEIRIEILQLLIKKSMTMSELSHELYVSLSSISMHVKKLQNVGLVEVIPKPGMHGAQKLCGIRAGRVDFIFFNENEKDKEQSLPKIMNIPIGSFIKAVVEVPCGLVNNEDYISIEDTVYSFYEPERVSAQLIWFTKGYLEYNVTNKYLINRDLKSVDISFEVCAEAPGYNNAWPSDLLILINDKSVANFRVDGDYGGNRGINNPVWWSDSNTQYGEFIKISITKDGSFLNGKKISRQTIESLNLKEHYYFKMRIGVDPNGEFQGGMNLFGERFGNYAQDIRIEIIYE